MILTGCELQGIPEVSELEKGMDFRKIEYRKEVFMRFYKFQMGFLIQPGLVYLFLPELAKSKSWTMEQRFWAAFLEGCTENPCTVWAIMQFFDNLPRDEQTFNAFKKWHSENWRLLDYDRDCRYNKFHLPEQVDSYRNLLRDFTQEEFFGKILYDPDPTKWFDNLWQAETSLYKFGRLTSWSGLEFVKILSGYDFKWSSLMMSDLNGSKSHRNGCLRVMGRDDLEWWKEANNGVTTHSKELCEATEYYGRRLTEELKERYKNETWSKYIGYETVESTLCAFKNCFHGERYPNVYTDMSYNRIKKAERLWGDRVDFSIFWKIREEKLPEKLLLEKNPNDPGLVPLKQEWFKKTGQLPMLSVMDPVFECDWDTNYYGDEVDPFFN